MSKLIPKNAKLAASCRIPGILYALGANASRSRFYAAGSDWSVYGFDANAEKLTAESLWTTHDNYVSALALLSEFRDAGSDYGAGTGAAAGKLLVSAGYDQRIHWVEVDSGRQIRSLDAHDGWIRDLLVLPDGRRLATIGDDMLLKLWDATTGKLLSAMDGHEKQTAEGYTTALYALAVTPDGKYAATGDRQGKVCLWELDSGNRVAVLHAPTFYTYDARARVRSIGGIRSLRFSPDGATLALAGIGKVTNVDGFVGPSRIELWDWRNEKPLATLEDKHKAVINDVVFHPTEPWLIAGGGGDSGGILSFWDLRENRLEHKVKPKGHLQRLILDESESRLFTAGFDGVQMWTCREKK